MTFAVSSPADGLAIVAESGHAADKLLSVMALRADVRKMLSSGKVARCLFEGTQPAGASEPEIREQVLICPLVAKDQLQGVIAVTSTNALPVEVTNTIETLAAQAGLALDREALTDIFHARRSEARFQTLVQNASDVILIARPDTTITYQTPSATRILGYEPGSLEGQRITTLVHPDDVEQALAMYTGVAFRAGQSTDDTVARPASRRLLAAPRSRGEQPARAIRPSRGSSSRCAT